MATNIILVPLECSCGRTVYVYATIRIVSPRACDVDPNTRLVGAAALATLTPAAMDELQDHMAAHVVGEQ